MAGIAWLALLGGAGATDETLISGIGAGEEAMEFFAGSLLGALMVGTTGAVAALDRGRG